MNLSLPRGTRDYSTKEAIALKEIVAITEDVFKRFGFSPLDTPALELMNVLDAKAYGEESTKEIFTIEGGEEGLRYDFTVPLARYMAMNKDLQLPFKRYQIDRIWRNEEPQKMRSKEFLQADIDIVGSTEPISEAEIIAATSLALEKLGVEDYTIFINSRIILNGILDMFKVPSDKQTQTIRLLDKLGKTSRDEISEQLQKLLTDQSKPEKLLNFLGEELTNIEKIQKLKTNIPSANEEINKLSEILRLLALYKIRGKVVVDLSLARGLDYYTSTIYEFVTYKDKKRLPSIAAGGRYDNLIGAFSKRSMPAAGCSIGINRIFDVIVDIASIKTYSNIYVAYIKEENLEYAMHVANTLRAQGIYADLDLTKRNLSKELEYANALNIKYVAIIGAQETNANKVKLRNMVNGEEEVLTTDQLIAKLKER